MSFTYSKIGIAPIFPFVFDGLATMERTSPSTSVSPAAIYFCSICDKPFINGRSVSRILALAHPVLTSCAEISRDRHVRYCGRHTRVRPRSCRACNTAKTKCNFEVPCMRCTTRGMDCVYDKLAATGRRKMPVSAVSAQPLTVEASIVRSKHLAEVGSLGCR